MRTRVLNHFHTFHPDAQAELDRLAREEQRLTVALARQGEEPAPRRRMSETLPKVDDLEAIRARMDEQRKAIASGVVRVVIKGLTRGEFRRLLAEHSPREGEALDAQLGYNADTFGDALIKACILRTENLDGETVPNEWDAWADAMTDGQWEEFFTACLKLTKDPNPSLPR